MSPALALVALLSVAAAADWTEFRGPSGDGMTAATGLPLKWSETENVRWATPIHGKGWSSPVIRDGQIWMTTAPEDGHEAWAVGCDLQTGRIVHDIKVFDVPEPQEIHTFNSYASPTPILEPGRVYVTFGAHGTACLDAQTGKTLWSRRDLACNHWRGPGSSPIIVDDKLILNFDGFDFQYVVALDKRTGRTLWKTERSTEFGDIDGDYRKAFATPIVITVDGRRQLISPGSKAIMAYDPDTGKELWKVTCKGFSATIRPLFGHGLVFLNTGFGAAELLAVRPDGSGDVTDTHVAWRLGKTVANKPSSILTGGRLFFVNDNGIAQGLNATSGKQLWQQRLEGKYSASPLGAPGRIYFFNQEGKTTVIAPGDEFKLLAENTLDDGFMASPAVAGKALILRTKTRLLRIETP